MTTPHRLFKDRIYEQLARVGKALAAPRRVELLDHLGQGPRTVEALAELAGTSVANASQHLQVLRAARLVEARKRGPYVEYRLADDDVSRFFVALRSLAGSRLAEVEQVTRAYFAGRGGDEAAFERLAPMVYGELKKIARGYMRSERPDGTMQAIVEKWGIADAVELLR